MDWVQVTFTFVYDLQKIIEILCMESVVFIDEESGFYGYKKQKKCGDIRILHSGGPGMGIHIQMSGQGCRQYETFQEFGWNQFIRRCLEAGGQFSRFDVAIDDIAIGEQKPYFRLNTVYRKAKEGCVKSRFFKGKYIESIDFKTGESIGQTMYFGREQSEIQIRMYEKDFERLSAGKELLENLTAWNRTEIQMRDERAQSAATFFSKHDDLLYIVQGVLSNYISFLVKDPNDSNRSRWPVCKWWDDFLDHAKKIRLSRVAPDQTIERSRTWIKNQVETTLGMLWAAEGYNVGFLGELLENGHERMNENQKKLAEEYSTQRVAENEEWAYIRRNKWQEYMFRTTRTQKRIIQDEDDRKETYLD